MNREIGHRTATLRNLTRGLILQQDASGAYLERIETVATKAKTLRPYVEKLITLGKKGTLHHRRQAFAILQDKEAVHRIFEDLAKRYANRPGGYTRILHTRRRMGDGVEMAYIEMIDRPVAAAPAASSEAEATANA
ncbi:50S ribosomal protein L17 [bacterium]|nr:50S ribosomal protein L17 [bacterium]